MEEDNRNPSNVLLEGEKKIVVIGNKGCGKSCLIASFITESPVDMTQDDHQQIRKTISFGRDRVTVLLQEVHTHPNHYNERMVHYLEMSAALVCFAFNDAISIRSVSKCINELKPFCRLVDLYVVGCKLDQKRYTPISAKEWLEFEKIIFPYKYLECSARTGEGVSHVVRIVGNVLLNQLQSGNSAVHR